jgi:hypothetical protein
MPVRPHARVEASISSQQKLQFEPLDHLPLTSIERIASDTPWPCEIKNINLAQLGGHLIESQNHSSA